MNNSLKHWIFLLATGLGVALSCLSGATPTRAQEAEAPAAALPVIPPGLVPEAEIPFFADWAVSPHAMRSAEAFNHWNEDGAIPTTCAKCHSTPGFRDFVGADGTAPGVVDHPAPVGTVIGCIACHNSATLKLDAVTFPSGVEVSGLGPNARCMTCHQGRASSDSVAASIDGLKPDVTSDKLRFINIHYRAAGATLFGSVARGAYQYQGKTYVGQMTHFEPYTTCIGCHDMHETTVRIDECAACHKGVTDAASLREIRIGRNSQDYDGDGDTAEGIAQEVNGLQDHLLAAIQVYAKSVAGTPIVYDADSYPYFFADLNGNGAADADETTGSNGYKAWTPRLLRAAYNYQFVEKDPGGYSHNAAYVLQVMFDGIEDLASQADIRTDGLQRP